jgi:hypothetical protein
MLGRETLDGGLGRIVTALGSGYREGDVMPLIPAIGTHN